MSFCPTALSALEHGTARRLEPLDAPAGAGLDGGRSLRAPIRDALRERAVAITAAAAADNAPDHGPSGPATPPAGRDPGRDLGRDPAREALERTCLTVKRIAHDIGMPRATLEAYRLGTRRMPPAARARLGAYLATHAAMLDELAQALMSPTTVVPPSTLGALDVSLDPRVDSRTTAD